MKSIEKEKEMWKGIEKKWNERKKKWKWENFNFLEKIKEENNSERKRMEEKKRWENWIFSRKCSRKFLQVDTRFALIPSYETWHPLMKERKAMKILYWW
jgi:hypothetical protein